MADMPTEFWGGYIVGISIISFIGLVWLVFSVYFSRNGDPELADHVWDNDLREGDSPAPLWWFWLILATMLFSVVYLMLYPGLGTFKGALEWSQGHEIGMAQQHFAATFGPERARIAATPATDLVAEEQAVESGAHVYRVHCAGCHGNDAGGQAGLFPNLTDDEWQWGRDEAQITQTIRGGRTAVMPPWLGALQEDGVAAMTDFVIAMSEGRAAEAQFAAAKARYDQLCIACHAADGSGNALLGAAPLNDRNWLYGGDYDAVYTSIADGRSGMMPGFGDRLDATQIKLVTAWLLAGAPAH